MSPLQCLLTCAPSVSRWLIVAFSLCSDVAGGKQKRLVKSGRINRKRAPPSNGRQEERLKRIKAHFDEHPIDHERLRDVEAAVKVLLGHDACWTRAGDFG